MKQEKPKSTPVDPNRPENPVELLVRSANYLARQATAWAAIAHDGAECSSAEAQAALMAELDRGLGTYRDRGLRALVNIVNEVVDQHNAMVARLDAATKQQKGKDDGTKRCAPGNGASRRLYPG